jgi:hypothetical protein
MAPVMDRTASGTLVMRPPAAQGCKGAPLPAPPAAAAPPLGDAEAKAWFAPEAGAAPMLALPRNLAPCVPARAQASVFALLTLASTVVFSLIAALALQLLERG